MRSGGDRDDNIRLSSGSLTTIQDNDCRGWNWAVGRAGSRKLGWQLIGANTSFLAEPVDYLERRKQEQHERDEAMIEARSAGSLVIITGAHCCKRWRTANTVDLTPMIRRRQSRLSSH